MTLNHSAAMARPLEERLDGLAVWAVPLVLLAAIVWSYWPVLVQLYRDWQIDQNYSVGQLVPLAAAYLLWHHRRRLAGVRLRVCWWGIGVIVLGQLMRAFGFVFLFESAERYSIVLTLAGVVLLVAGPEVFWRVRWILLLLLLMVPLPGRVHNLISDPLQTLSTMGALVTLELTGVKVVREGNVLLLNDSVPVAVAEACSGLRMLTAFVLVAAFMAFVIRRPAWQKWVLVLSSVPVAILSNLIRLVVTALLFLAAGPAVGNIFHDVAGLVMMPLAVALLVGELWIMSRLVIEERDGSTPAHV
jgi:exosortase